MENPDPWGTDRNCYLAVNSHTGTSTKKRTEFLRMIRQCKQKKIDLILTKSIQRFARNTLDCINYTRILRQLDIGVLFEKENINSLPTSSVISNSSMNNFSICWRKPSMQKIKKPAIRSLQKS